MIIRDQSNTIHKITIPPLQVLILSTILLVLQRILLEMEAAVYVICYVAGAVVENELVYQPTMKVIGVVATVSFAGVMLTKNIVQNGLIYFTS
mmetsp:Transcript_8139/g.9372  ORF Transcript_8139/g.9372 Transcript_8139/m.9372 type:complete len:93 (-) Transcript_8139:3463-3741(-)